jgi:arylformamidase
MKASDPREHLDQQFNPTLWTPRLEADDVLPAHIEYSERESQHYRDGLSAQDLTAISYSFNGKTENIDVFRPSNIAKDAPIVVYIHGGWWQWFSKDMFAFVAKPFNEAGLAVYMPAYTMAQDWNAPDSMRLIAEQLEQAMIKVFEDAAGNGTKQILLVGHSAGGHLVSLLHRIDWQIKHGVSKDVAERLTDAISLAGLFDLRPLTNCYVNDAINMSAAEAEYVSPACQTVDRSRSYPALHLILPEYDTPEFFRQTKAYQQQLLENGINCSLSVLPEKDHVSMIEEIPAKDDTLTKYILDKIRAV